MKFVCLQEELREALSRTAAAAARKGDAIKSGSYAACYLLVIADEALQKIIFVGGRDSHEVTWEIGGKVERSGTATVKPDLFEKMCAKLPKGELTIELKQDCQEILEGEVKYETHGVSLEAMVRGRLVRYTVQGVPACNYYRYDLSAPAHGEVTVNSGDLCRMLEVLESALPVYSNSIGRAVGVSWSEVVFLRLGNELEGVATSGHRLGWYRLGLESPYQTEDPASSHAIMIPGKICREARLLVSAKSSAGRAVRIRLIGESGSFTMLELSFMERSLLYPDSYVRREIRLRPVAGTYPLSAPGSPDSPVASLLRESRYRVSFNRLELIEAIERVSVAADDTDGVAFLRMDLRPKEAQLALSNEGQYSSGSEVVACEFSGELMHMGFMARYLVDCLKVFMSDRIRLNINAANGMVGVFAEHDPFSENSPGEASPGRFSENSPGEASQRTRRGKLPPADSLSPGRFSGSDEPEFYYAIMPVGRREE